jgi:hypothetical protein
VEADVAVDPDGLGDVDDPEQAASTTAPTASTPKTRDLDIHGLLRATVKMVSVSG